MTTCNWSVLPLGTPSPLALRVRFHVGLKLVSSISQYTKQNQNTAVFAMEVAREDMSFPFEKAQGREAVWQVERTWHLYQADLGLNPESSLCGYTTLGILIGIHIQGRVINTRQDCWPHAWKGPRGIPIMGWGVTQHLDSIIFVTGPKPLATDRQWKSTFTTCSGLPYSNCLETAYCSPLQAHTPLLPLSSHSLCISRAIYKSCKSSEVTEKLFLIECDSLTQISLCLWISLCYHLFSRLIAAMATAHPSAETQA